MIHISKFTNNTSNIKSIDFGILGNKEILSRSCFDKKGVGISTGELWSCGEPKDNGFLDLRHGSCSEEYACKTCQLRYQDCINHESHIRLARPVYHLGFFDVIIQILNVVCDNCSALLIPDKTDEIIKNIENKKLKNKLIEIKKYVKNVKNCPVCNNVICPIKSDIIKDKGSVNIKKELKTENNTLKIYDNISATKVFGILKNIRTNDAKLMGLSCRPEDLMHVIFPVPGVHMRPSVRGDFTTMTTTEDKLTMKLVDIFKANEKALQHASEPTKSEKIKDQYLNNNLDYLQFHIATYLNNESLNKPHTEHKSGPTKSLMSIFKKKDGRFRGSLMRKRVFHSARTVITSEPTISCDELRIPQYIAKILTYPEMVCPSNINFLSNCVKNGPTNYVGANFVRRGKTQFDLRIYKNFELRMGDIVERHLIDGDVVLFNRQPTLHKHGMLTHRVRVCQNPNIYTFGVNPSVCKGYNADFDGDEMNCHTPQSVQTKIELENLVDVKYQIMSPATSQPILQSIQDCLVGAYCLTKFEKKINSSEAMDLIATTNITNFDLIKKNSNYTGTEMYSFIIPDKINLSLKSINIKQGKIINGYISKECVGASKNNLTQTILEVYDATTARDFLNNTNNTAIQYNFLNGFTIGLYDYLISDEHNKNIQSILDAKLLEILCDMTEYENNPSIMDIKLFESSIIDKLNTVRDKITTYTYSIMDEKNPVRVLVDSGSKGNKLNIVQMSGSIGQQDYEGARMPKNYNNRTAPYFYQNDDRPISRGFIKNSFVKGLSLSEFFFHTITSREGVINTAVKTAVTGYIQRKLVKASEDFTIKYDGTVRNSTGKIYQFIYGDSNADTCKQYNYNLKFLKMSNDEIKENYLFYDNKNIQFNNDEHYDFLIKGRDMLRELRVKFTVDFMTFNNDYMIPVNLNLLFENILDEKITGETTTPKYILDKINYILNIKNTCIVSISNADKLNPLSIKYKDNEINKTLFKYCLYDCLNFKKIINLKLTNKHIDLLSEKIIKNFKESMIEAGDMVGTTASQSLGQAVTQLTLNTFHSSGLGGATSVVGIPRLEEIFSTTKNMKSPQTTVYFMDTNKNNINKIASYIKYTTISQLATNFSIYYEPLMFEKDNFMEIDNVKHIYAPDVQTATSCSKKIDGLYWLIRIEFDKEKMFLKETSLLDIKTKLALQWEKRHSVKKRDLKKILDKIIQLAIVSNTDNAEVPIIHIRFSSHNINITELIEFKTLFIEEFRIKGIDGIDEIFGNKIFTVDKISFDDKTGKIITEQEHIINTKGINVEEMRNIVGVDLNRTFINDVVLTYEYYGIECARTLIIHEIDNVYTSKGEKVNYQHIALMADCICSSGYLTSLDRHGLNKLTDNGVISRATFEKPCEQVLSAGIFGETDNIVSVSSSIACGACIKSGTNAANIYINYNMIMASEYTHTNDYLYDKNFKEITETKHIVEEDDDIFIPSF
jgi:DNA-directed RNA polymerase II subunit RPB1